MKSFAQEPAAGSALTRGARAAVSGGADAGAFAEKLGQLVESVEETAAEANTAINGMIDKSVDVHEAMLAITKRRADVSADGPDPEQAGGAYQEIMRMPV